MPDPIKLIAALQKASVAFRQTPGRKGYVVTLPEDAEVLVAGDLHGNLDNFRRLLEIAQLTANPKRHLIVQELVHGPFRYPNGGGDRSHQLIDVLSALKLQYPSRVHMLLGNHELSEATGRRIAKSDIDQNALFRQGVTTAYGEHAEDVYQGYVRLFHSLDLAVRTANRVFLSHSLPGASRLASFKLSDLEAMELPPDALRLGGCVHSLVWGRDTRIETVTEFLRLVDADWLISGHIPASEGYDLPNERQIVLDSLDTPAAYCLFSASEPLTREKLVGSIKLL